MGDFTVTITDPARCQEFESVLGVHIVPVQSPIATIGHLPGRGMSRFYLLATDQLTPDDRLRLARHLSEKFRMDMEQVLQYMDRDGVPIPAEHCLVAIANPQKWLL